MKKHFSFAIACIPLFAFTLVASQVKAQDLRQKPNTQRQTLPCKPDNSSCPQKQKRPKPSHPFPITSTGPTVPPKAGVSANTVGAPTTPPARARYRSFYKPIFHGRQHARETRVVPTNAPVGTTKAPAAKKNPCEPPTTAKKCRDWINGKPKPPIRPKSPSRPKKD